MHPPSEMFCTFFDGFFTPPFAIMASHTVSSKGLLPTHWYVSNVSIIFDCSMLYYVLFWTLLGFIIHFYIIFGTNLLTGGPAQNWCFFAYFSVSKKRNIKRSPNGMKPSGTWFSHRTSPGRLGAYVKQPTGRPRGRGAPTPQAPSTLVRPLLLHRRTPSSYMYLRTPKRSDTEPKPWFHHRNFLNPRDRILGPVSELRRRGHPSRRASTSTP